MSNEIERRTIISDAAVEYREDKKPVITGYAAVFNMESRNLGGFVETIHPNAFDDVLAENPDVIGVFNHDRNLLLGRTGNGTMRLTKDAYGLRYEITPNENTSIGRDVVEWVKDRTVVGSSFAFQIKRDGGDAWSTDSQRGIRKREVRAVGLLEDVGPVVRPAYDSSSVVVSRRAIEMALGEEFRPTKTMANAAKRGLKLAKDRESIEERLLFVAERLVNREIISVEEVSYLGEVFKRCLVAKETGWSGSPAWIEWQLAGGDTAVSWITRRSEEPRVVVEEERAESSVDLKPSAGMAAAARRGLKLHEEGRSGDGLKPETVARANKIASRDTLTPAHVREMRAWFRRHKVDKRAGWSAKGSETPGYTAWMLWGGDAGWRWSEAKVAQMEREGGKRDVGESEEGMGEEEYPGTLTAANLDLAESYEMVVEANGQFAQELPDGAHYMEASPFKSQGLACANCVFYEGGGACELVSGSINANGLCKLWIIPQEKIASEAPKQAEESKPAEEDRSKPFDAHGAVAELQATLLRTRLHGTPRA
jgi:hypothetical protein